MRPFKIESECTAAENRARIAAEKPKRSKYVKETKPECARKPSRDNPFVNCIYGRKNFGGRE